MATLDPQSVTTAVITVVGLVAAVDAGMAFLMRTVQEATPDD